MAKLSDTQLIVLSAATQRDDGIAALPDRLRGGAALKVIKPLLARGFMEEIPTQPGMPVWRRDTDADRSYSLAITHAGRSAINVAARGSELASDAGKPNNDALTPAKPASSLIASKRKRDNHVTAARANKHQSRQRSKSTEFRSNSKQGKIITMLRAPGGTTIEAIMKMTGWQQHSVRGFFAGVVRKKMKLNLSSVKSDGRRTYRVVRANPTKPGSRESRHRAA